MIFRGVRARLAVLTILDVVVLTSLRNALSNPPVRLWIAIVGTICATVVPPTYANQAELHDIPAPNVEEELAQFIVADGFEVNLFAADPMLANPIGISWDADGRLWVAGSSIYPHIPVGRQLSDSITVIEDVDGDGVADTSTVFAKGLFIPTSVLPGDGGVYVCNSTEIIHLRDTDGDGKADTTKVVLSGFGTEDTHQTVHGLRWGMDGLMYFNQSIYIHSHIETPYCIRRLGGGGIWQFNPQTLKLEVFSRGFVNPWGHHQDAWGQSFVTDGAYYEGINYTFPGATFVESGITPILPGMNPGSPKHCGLEILSGRHLPDDWQGNYITHDFRGHRVCRFVVSENGTGYLSQEQTELIKTKHVWFRPVDVKMGPDGAIYIADWHNPIIQHGEVDFRDPRRDHEHGRIWRVTAKDRRLVQRPQITSASLEELLSLTLAEEEWTRIQARQTLKARPREAATAALETWLKESEATGTARERQVLEALWNWQTLDVVAPEVLSEALAATDYRVRAAAVRVMSYWLDRLSPADLWYERARVLATEEHPRVRLEAVRLLSQVPGSEALLAALGTYGTERDPYLDHALLLTLRERKGDWLPEVQRDNPKFTGRSDRLLFALDAIASSEIVPPLLNGLAQMRFDDDQAEKAIELVAAHGNAVQAGIVLEALCARLEKDDESALRLWSALLEGTRKRNLQPGSGLERVAQLGADKSGAIQMQALEAAGAWRIEAARPVLENLLKNGESTREVRDIGIEALRSLGGEASTTLLLELTRNHPDRATRVTATSALVLLAPAEAAGVAVSLLQDSEGEGEVKQLIGAFVRQEPSLAALVKRLDGVTLPREAAKQTERILTSSGRNVDAALAAVRRAGGLLDQDALWNAESKAALVAAARSNGDPARGEMYYRALACVQCHAIGGSGGTLGPDLSSIGGSAQIDYLVESIVQPNKMIKEGYHSVLVETAALETYSGIKVQENDTTIVLRDVNGEHTIFRDQIEALDDGQSLMPVGLVDGLLESEAADLISFLASLGRVPEWSVGTEKVVRTWEVLQSSPDIAQRLLQSGPEVVAVDHEELVWAPAYSTVAGVMPVSELPKVIHYYWVNEGYSAARFTLSASEAGTVFLKAPGAADIACWVNGERVVLAERTALTLPAGESTVVVLIDHEKAPEALQFSLEDDPASSAVVQIAL